MEEALVHCTKCMVRSRLWQPESWNAAGLASIAETIVAHAGLDMPVAELESLAANDVRTRLY